MLLERWLSGRCDRALIWVKPSLVVQVAFTEWTDGGSMRHARFIDLRTDKCAVRVHHQAANGAEIGAAIAEV